jgi:hypothetical protein
MRPEAGSEIRSQTVCVLSSTAAELTGSVVHRPTPEAAVAVTGCSGHHRRGSYPDSAALVM